jgi:hypothetical protein
MMPKMANPTPSKTVSSRSVSLIGTIGLLLLVCAGLAYGLVLAYKTFLVSSITGARETLVASEKQFEPELIAELTVLDRQLTLSQQLLEKHVQISPILDMLSEKTLTSVQFDEFDYELGDATVTPVIRISGQARSYRAIAQQSTVLSNDARVQEHIFSDFIVNESGKVEFQLKIIPSPNALYFVKWYVDAVQESALLPIATVPVAETQNPLEPAQQNLQVTIPSVDQSLQVGSLSPIPGEPEISGGSNAPTTFNIF